MKKTYKLGKCDGYGNGRKINLCEFVFELKDTAKGPVFTMSANVWNHIHSDIIMGGQCCDEILKYFRHDKKAARMVEIWRQYHLNDMHPECEHQRELGWREMAVEAITVEGAKKTKGWTYEKDGGILCKPCPVCGYKYGSAWQYMPIPADIIEEIKSW